MKSFRSKHNLIAVSANNKETSLNTEQTLDTSLLVDVGDILGLEPRRENNTEELTGKEEADTVYDLGDVASGKFTFNKAQPQHLAFLAAYGLGAVATAVSGTGYCHTITPIDGDLSTDRSVPTFTASQRLGKVVGKRLLASMAVDQFAITFAKDEFVKATGNLKGTGKHTDTIVEETITAKDDATSLNLAANGVAGSTDAERLDNIHQIRVELTAGVWTEVEFSAVSSATPAAITITAPGSATADVNYKVLYAPVEPAWATFPSRVVESPLKVADLNVTLGGKWTGSAFEGGRALTSEIASIEWTMNNNLEVSFVPGAGGAYASRVWRDGRAQVLKLEREMRDWILQNYQNTNEVFAVRLYAVGAEFATGETYKAEIIFPRVGVLSAPVTVSGKVVAEPGDLAVLQDDTYGSVITKITNQVATYAA